MGRAAQHRVACSDGLAWRFLARALVNCPPTPSGSIRRAAAQRVRGPGMGSPGAWLVGGYCSAADQAPLGGSYRAIGSPIGRRFKVSCSRNLSTWNLLRPELDGHGLRFGLRSTPNPSISALSWPDSRNAPAGT